MHLYFLRHGKAEEHIMMKPDRERQLVARGEEDARALAERLKALEVTFNAIFTSPYPRAHQTATIIAKGLGLEARLQATDKLASGRFDWEEMQAMVEGQGSNASLLFVGHQPDLSLTIQRLTGGACEMKTASLAYVETDRVEPNRGVLQWLLPPRVLAIRL